MMAIRSSRTANRGIRERAQVTEKAQLLKGQFMGTMQAGPARPKRAHGLSDEHQDRGLLYVEKQFWDDAIKEFQKAVDLSPDFSEGLNNLGLCYVYSNKFEEAIQALEEAVRHFPGWHIALANLGLAYQKAKNFDQAITYYRQAVNKQPKMPQVWEALAECLEGKGQLDEAAEAYRHALSHSKKYDIALYRLGMLLARKTEFDEAEGHLKGALEINPALGDAAGVLGAIAARRGQLDAARVYFEQARSAKPDKVPQTAARGLAALDHYEKTVQANFEEMLGGLEDLPSIAECMFNAGLASLKGGNRAMARSSFENAASEDTEWADPLVWLGVLEAAEMRPVEARKHLDAARKLAPDNGVIPETIGLACMAMGLTKEAEKQFVEARKLGRQIVMPTAATSSAGLTSQG